MSKNNSIQLIKDEYIQYLIFSTFYLDSKNQDTESCYSNTIASNFLKEILELFLNENMKIRQDALNVISIILEQGLVYQSEVKIN